MVNQLFFVTMTLEAECGGFSPSGVCLISLLMTDTHWVIDPWGLKAGQHLGNHCSHFSL